MCPSEGVRRWALSSSPESPVPRGPPVKQALPSQPLRDPGSSGKWRELAGVSDAGLSGPGSGRAVVGGRRVHGGSSERDVRRRSIWLVT